MSYFKVKNASNFDFGWAPSQTPLGEFIALLRPLARFKGLRETTEEWEGGEGKGGEGKGEERKGKGRVSRIISSVCWQP